jgi:hypothetical protein
MEIVSMEIVSKGATSKSSQPLGPASGFKGSGDVAKSR